MSQRRRWTLRFHQPEETHAVGGRSGVGALAIGGRQFGDGAAGEAAEFLEAHAGLALPAQCHFAGVAASDRDGADVLCLRFFGHGAELIDGKSIRSAGADVADAIVADSSFVVGTIDAVFVNEARWGAGRQRYLDRVDAVTSGSIAAGNAVIKRLSVNEAFPRLPAAGQERAVERHRVRGGIEGSPESVSALFISTRKVTTVSSLRNEPGARPSK